MKQCLMLAAGLSSRMGQWKMLLPWGEGTVLDSALRNALGFCDRVILVTGHRGEELHARYADDARILLCHNDNYASGMFSSVRCGAGELAPGPFFMVPGDMPMIPAPVYAALWQQHSDECCLVPEYEGGFGHPVLLPADMRRAILAAADDDNLKRLIQAKGRRPVAVPTASIHWDLDTPAQYQALSLRLNSSPDHTS